MRALRLAAKRSLSMSTVGFVLVMDVRVALIELWVCVPYKTRCVMALLRWS